MAKPRNLGSVRSSHQPIGDPSLEESVSLASAWFIANLQSHPLKEKGLKRLEVAFVVFDALRLESSS